MRRKVGVVDGAIFDRGHGVHFSLRPISILTAFKRKPLTTLIALAMATSACAADVASRRAIEVRALNAELLSRPSATETLTRWCAAHHLAAEPKIVAIPDASRAALPDARTLHALGDPPPGTVRRRHVALRCGTRILSEADNWYRPDRLTAAMNAALETTQTPFGTVVKPLGFTRRTVSVTMMSGRKKNPPQPYVLRHRAVLSTAAGLPFSVVVESYTSEIAADLGR